MNKSIKDEIIDAIKNERIEKKDEGSFPSAHSEPFFYKTLNDDHFVLLRARKDSKYATQADIIESYRKQQSLYPFLSKQNLP
ncbi:MAG: hypothetical protein LBL96_06490, partial [Clostridiales bacterium]|nr:hypothetical protein [Clostridiales bacterium]